MGRYIDADELVKLYTNTPTLNLDGYRVPIEVVRENIKDAPTANVVEVKHGEWKRVECGTICTQCRRVYDNDFEFSHEKVKQNFKYCPNCGADMRERGE